MKKMKIPSWAKQKIWEVKNSLVSLEVPPPFPMPPLIWKLLHSRGLTTKEKIESHISPKLLSMTSPYALDGMEKGVERLIQAFVHQEKICIYADFDLDGSAGLTILKTAFKALGFKHLSHLQPKRLKDGYGFHKSMVKDIEEEGTKLIITVDVGTSDFEAVQEAQSLGIDVIVTDHHLPPQKLPPAHVVINPNKEECSSDLGYLCGTGVAFYLALALRSELKKQSLLASDFDPKSLLDCFVIGTLTDMVPVRNENRTLIKHGLLVLEKTKRPGLQELLKTLGLWNRPLTSVDVTMRFAPKINALSRMEGKILPVDLFLVEEEEAAKKCVEEVMASHQKRLFLQKQTEEEAMRSLESSEGKRKFIFLCSKNFHKGVLGLLATKLSQDFSCPAFIGSIDEEKGCIFGSARAPKTDHLKLEDVKVSKDLKPDNLISAFQFSSTSLLKFGGHAMAAGFQLEASKAENFRELLSEYYNKFPFPPPAKTFYDGVGSLREIDIHFMDWYEKLEPFGVQFEIPFFLIPHLEIRSVFPLRGGHLKMLFRESHPSIHEIEGVWFSPPKSFAPLFAASESTSSSRSRSLLTPHSSIKTVDVVAEPQWNHFNGKKKIQLLIKDIRPSVSSATSMIAASSGASPKA